MGSAAFHDKESLMHVLRERPAHPLETRPSTTHMLYRASTLTCYTVSIGREREGEGGGERERERERERVFRPMHCYK